MAVDLKAEKTQIGYLVQTLNDIRIPFERISVEAEQVVIGQDPNKALRVLYRIPYAVVCDAALGRDPLHGIGEGDLFEGGCSQIPSRKGTEKE